ncbi:uncharacterized protein LOC135487815 [Lineus longissimus]|uniref:uncharacterized protein LOC135487815 n=1 Tax=Lineus longissimus TaxID=88925 RepID=UPI00315D0F15
MYSVVDRGYQNEDRLSISHGQEQKWALQGTPGHSACSACVKCTMAADNIPVVDFGACGPHWLSSTSKGTYGDEVLAVAEAVGAAFKEYGFVYLENHGIDQALIDKITSKSNDFFQLPVARKELYKRRKEEGNNGWVSMKMEHIDPSKPGDLKEAYNYTLDSKLKFPADVPFLEEANAEFFTACKELALRVLKVLGIALKPEDGDYFANAHSFVGDTSKNQTTLRCLYYPPLEGEPEPGQLRLGEHSDYGSITLLFQDNVGGLEIQRKKSGRYIPATPMSGAVLINSGDLMERWTMDQIPAPKHRVLIPEEEMKTRQIRRSVVFFCQPDDDVMITCLDGSNKYEPITSLNYLLQKLNMSYEY